MFKVKKTQPSYLFSANKLSEVSQSRNSHPSCNVSLFIVTFHRILMQLLSQSSHCNYVTSLTNFRWLHTVTLKSPIGSVNKICVVTLLHVVVILCTGWSLAVLRRMICVEACWSPSVFCAWRWSWKHERENVVTVFVPRGRVTCGNREIVARFLVFCIRVPRSWNNNTNGNLRRQGCSV